MNKQLAHSIISKWIHSCLHEEQVAIAHEAVCNLYDAHYKAAGTPESEELHSLCMQKTAEIKNKGAYGKVISEPKPSSLELDETDPMCEIVAGKD